MTEIDIDKSGFKTFLLKVARVTILTAKRS